MDGRARKGLIAFAVLFSLALWFFGSQSFIGAISGGQNLIQNFTLIACYILSFLVAIVGVVFCSLNRKYPPFFVIVLALLIYVVGLIISNILRIVFVGPGLNAWGIAIIAINLAENGIYLLVYFIAFILFIIAMAKKSPNLYRSGYSAIIAAVIISFVFTVLSGVKIILQFLPSMGAAVGGSGGSGSGSSGSGEAMAVFIVTTVIGYIGAFLYRGATIALFVSSIVLKNSCNEPQEEPEVIEEKE